MDYIQEEEMGDNTAQRKTHGTNLSSDDEGDETERMETHPEPIEEIVFDIQEHTSRGVTQLEDRTELVITSPQEMEVMPEDINNHLIGKSSRTTKMLN